MARRKSTTKTKLKKRTRKKKQGWFAQFATEFMSGLGRELEKQTASPEFRRKAQELGGDVYHAIKARALRK